MSLGLDSLVPPYAAKVVGIGELPQALLDHCKKSGKTCSWMTQTDFPQMVAEAQDCILVGQGSWHPERLEDFFNIINSFLAPNGRVAVVIQGLYRTPCEYEKLDLLLERFRWMRYAEGALNCGAKVSSAWALTAVRQEYNPVIHARRMSDIGRPDWALDILNAIPSDLVSDARCSIAMKMEKKRYIDRLMSSKVEDKPKRSLPIYLGLVQGDGYGWGVCSRYLVKEMSKIATVTGLDPEDGSTEDSSLPGPLFQALVNVDFDPIFPKARGVRNFGYTFFENELTERSKENAQHYDCVLGGSTWCRDRMLEKGIGNCDVLIQGIDPDLFYPIDQPVDPERFVIFSGGKFELRKGQDLVLRAVKVMQDKYPDVWLVNCWYNLWPASTRLMSYSPHIRFAHHEKERWIDTMQRTYLENGLDGRRIITHELVPQGEQRALFAGTDIGLFPNRCEGGTNLVLMEYMACAKPVIAAYTSGHKDVLTDSNALLLNQLRPFNIVDAGGVLTGRWQEACLDEMVAQLEFAYHRRAAIQYIGRQAGKDLKQFTWAHSAARLMGFIEK